MNIAAIVETRQIPNFRKLVENHVHYSGFKPMIFHGANNGDWLKKELDGIDALYFNIGVNELSASGYNKLLTSAFFWKQIPSEKILIFQHDSWMLRKGIEEFYPYNFIGSPLYHIPMPCMNGGVSLRDKTKMLEVIEKVPYSGIENEDIFFCKGIEKIGGVLPTKEIASQFGVETLFNFGSLCVHAIEKWHSEHDCKLLLNQYNQQ